MENSGVLYNRLRDLYSKEETKQDSISKGLAIEKIINRLMADVVSPFKLELDMSYGNNRFDGGVSLGRGKTLLYEIYLGSIRWFDYHLFWQTLMETHFGRRIYILNIAYGFSEQDRRKIEELVHGIRTSNTRVLFVDYETLMALHKFNEGIEKETDKQLRKTKMLFLEKLFENSGIISSSIFENALGAAKERYSSELQRKAEGAEFPPTFVMEQFATRERLRRLEGMTEERLGRLEEMAQKLLNEIHELKDALKRKQY